MFRFIAIIQVETQIKILCINGIDCKIDVEQILTPDIIRRKILLMFVIAQHNCIYLVINKKSRRPRQSNIILRKILITRDIISRE